MDANECNFTKHNLSYSNFYNTDFQYTLFKNANLKNVSFEGANLFKTVITGAKNLEVDQLYEMMSDPKNLVVGKGDERNSKIKKQLLKIVRKNMQCNNINNVAKKIDQLEQTVKRFKSESPLTKNEIEELKIVREKTEKLLKTVKEEENRNSQLINMGRPK